ncbi:MAG TPA: hypothetical protein VH475_18535 [Tepidisphaeraceae bacterium]|jgi:hypothetical protein
MTEQPDSDSDLVARVKAMLKAAGMRCVAESVWVGLAVFRDNASVPVLGQFLRCILVHSRFLKKYLNIRHVELVGAGDAPSREFVDPVRIVECVIDLARKHGHTEVNEMHFLAAAVLLHESEAAVVFQPLVEEERDSYPDGRPWQQEMVEWYRVQRPDLLPRVQENVHSTQFRMSVVKRRILTYIESGFYPYDATQWKRYTEVQDSDLPPFSVPPAMKVQGGWSSACAAAAPVA